MSKIDFRDLVELSTKLGYGYLIPHEAVAKTKPITTTTKGI